MQAIKGLRKSEEELRQILDLTPQCIVVFGPNRERIFMNRIALDYLGVTLDEWINRRVTGKGPSEIHPDDEKRIHAQWDRALSSGSDFHTRHRIRKAHRSHSWLLAAPR